jgi:oligopeptidase A
MSGAAGNPLIGIQFRIPFDEVRAEHVEPAVAQLLEEARGAVESFASAEGPRNYQNTLERLDRLTEKLDYAVTVVRHLESVATYPELRNAYNAVEPAISAFYSSIPLHTGLWEALKAYAATDEAKALTGVRGRFLKKTLNDFRRHGADLDAAGKVQLEKIDIELAGLTTKFSQNTLDATNAFELVIEEESKLSGLPQNGRDVARDSAESKGMKGWRFTLQAPSYVPALMYLDDASIRRRLWEAYNTRASSGKYDNSQNITRILELRRAKAELLGYADYSDLVLEDRMAKTGEQAQTFLEELKVKTAARFGQENEELSAFRKELEGAEAPPLEPWDVAYYAEKLREARFAFNEEDLRPYFPLDAVIAGLFDLVGRLYGIRIVEQTGAPVWDPQTKFYTLLDESGEELGAFYSDWFPRENKRGGAWMDSFLTGRPTETGFEPHLGLMCGNLNPPVGGKPPLLTHRDVETIFHEFGHLLHHLLTRVPVRSLAGTNVAWDFVELPSQIMENWCWEREALDLFARHWETGEPIPEDLFGKMKRARTFRGANAQMRQLSFGLVDLALHRQYSPKTDPPVTEYTRRMMAEFSPAPLPADYSMITAFTHLFSSPVGYAAGYYSYKWAEVLDADAFTRFQEAGVFSRGVGTEFREKILAKGDGEDPAELYRSFMGRDPNVEALLERTGLLPVS